VRGGAGHGDGSARGAELRKTPGWVDGPHLEDDRLLTSRDLMGGLQQGSNLGTFLDECRQEPGSRKPANGSEVVAHLSRRYGRVLLL
jgi:hypothetical protein